MRTSDGGDHSPTGNGHGCSGLYLARSDSKNVTDEMGTKNNVKV